MSDEWVDRELTDEELARMRPADEVLPPSLLRKLRGAQKAPTKVQVTVRLDPDVLERLKADGPGWQPRMNTILRQALDLDAGVGRRRASSGEKSGGMRKLSGAVTASSAKKKRKPGERQS